MIFFWRWKQQAAWKFNEQELMKRVRRNFYSFFWRFRFFFTLLGSSFCRLLKVIYNFFTFVFRTA